MDSSARCKPIAGTLCMVALFLGALVGTARPAGFEAPAGLPPVPVPDDNEMTAAKVELGKMLYFDKRLSGDGTISCATCHDPKMGWTERRATSKGIKGQIGGRNSPSVINAAYHTAQFWDGRAKSLEEQAVGPIENPIEMGAKLDDVVAKLVKIPGYVSRFKDAFGTEVNKDGIAKAIASFERTVLSGNSPYDRYQAGDHSALNERQKRGMDLFMNEAMCATCHTPPLFSNGRYFNAGIDASAEKPDEGRKAVTKNDRDFGKFRVPALREVANTGPYFHNGSVDSLQKAVQIMAHGGIDNSNLSPMLKVVREANLTKENVKDLIAFLEALSGTYPVSEAPELP